MKPIFKILAAAFAVGMIGSASAQTTITLTGSTAFRSSAHSAIVANLSNLQYAYTGASLSGASQAIFTGNLGATPVIIKTSWSGSITGIVNVKDSNTVPVLPNSTTQSPGGTASAPVGVEAVIPDLAFSDVSHTSTPFSDPSLEEREVGVIPFLFVASKDTPAHLTNVTTQLLRQMWSNGFVPLAMATGDPDDRTTLYTSTFGNAEYGTDIPFLLFALGRNAGSGTRFTYLAETGVGVASTIVQYLATNDGTTVSSHVPYPPETVDGIDYEAGESGYESGGTVRNIMRMNTLAAIGGGYITMLGLSDATFVTNPAGGQAGPGRALSYNGVTFSTDALVEGQYSVWAPQQLINRGPAAGPLATFINTLTTSLRSVDLYYNNLQVSRLGDGGTIFPLYP